MSRKKWARVIDIGINAAHAVTLDKELVMVPMRFFGMDELQKGDIISFVPTSLDGQQTGPATLFARYPAIIARRYRTSKTRDAQHGGPNPCAWKENREHATDAQLLREVLTRAAGTGLATTPAAD